MVQPSEIISLESFWSYVSFRPGLTATAGEWERSLGADAWKALKKRIFRNVGVAKTIADEKGHTLKVIQTPDRRFALISSTDEMYRETGLKREDVLAYRLEIAALCQAVSPVLGITLDPGSVDAASHAVPMGDWRVTEAVGVPVFLMLPPSSDRLIDEIRRLLVEFSAGFLLLMPTQPVLDSTIRNQLEQHQSSVLSLNEIVAWGASGFVAAPTWETHRNAYVAKHHADRMVAAPPAYALQRQGDFWIVRFDGQQTILKDTVGMAYITELVAQPHEKVFAPDLLAAVSGHAAVSETSSAGPQTDKQTLDEVKQKYLDAQAELEEAERNNDLAAQERLQRELDGLTDYLKTVKGFNGRTREASDEADKIRRAMTQAIGRVQDSLGAEGKLPAAAQHLRNAIKTGLFMSYEPEEELHWSL